MNIAEHVSALTLEGERLARHAVAAGLETVVPTCPDWRVADLLRHLGGVHRWAAAYVLTGQTSPFPPAEAEAFYDAPPDDELVPWFRAGHAALVEDLLNAEPHLVAWTFLPAPSPLAFWARRQAHETAIHAADAAAAAGASIEFSAAFAADGINELMTGWLPHRVRGLTADPARSFTATTVDTNESWTVHIGPDGVREAGEGEASACTLSAPASELYLMLWNRIEPAATHVTGDPAVLDLWRQQAAI